uniref:Uncharacterized protein n=2 Tax=Opuntia streptacantha TaxID=393608 RepID=A0A7C9D5D4_OPUST
MISLFLCSKCSTLSNGWHNPVLCAWPVSDCPEIRDMLASVVRLSLLKRTGTKVKVLINSNSHNYLMESITLIWKFRIRCIIMLPSKDEIEHHRRPNLLLLKTILHFILASKTIREHCKCNKMSSYLGMEADDELLAFSFSSPNKSWHSETIISKSSRKPSIINYSNIPLLFQREFEHPEP